MPSDPTLYLYTSLTAGSSHIITATSRIETILKANKLPFRAVDCATDDKARMLWARRSKGRKIPGLVKFNDVIADLEQVEELNEHGELEDHIEEQIDIFGDVPISATSAEAQSAAAERAQAQAEAAAAAKEGGGATRPGLAQARTASETRHISISDPKDQQHRKSSAASGSEKKDSPLSMAMRQAGQEAAAKGAMNKSGAGTVEVTKGTTAPRQRPLPDEIAKEEGMAKMPPPPPEALNTPPTLDDESEEVSKEIGVTDTKTPEQLAAQGATRTSIDKVASASASTEASSEEDDTASTEAQILEQRRKSSVPQSRSSLAHATSIDESHTIASSEDQSDPETSTQTNEQQGSHAAPAEQTEIKKTDVAAENNDNDDEKDGAPVKKAAKVSATDKGEEKVLGNTIPQDAQAADGSKAGDSVGD